MSTAMIVKMLETKLKEKCYSKYAIRSISYIDVRSQLISTGGVSLVTDFINKVAFFFCVASREGARAEFARSLTLVLSYITQLPGFDRRILKISDTARNIAHISGRLFRKTKNTDYLKLMLEALTHVGNADFLGDALPSITYLAMLGLKLDNADSSTMQKLVRLIHYYVSVADVSNDCVLDTLRKITLIMWNFKASGLVPISNVSMLSPLVLVLLIISEKSMLYFVEILKHLACTPNTSLIGKKLDTVHYRSASSRIARASITRSFRRNNVALTQKSYKFGKLNLDNILKLVKKSERYPSHLVSEYRGNLDCACARIYPHGGQSVRFNYSPLRNNIANPPSLELLPVCIANASEIHTNLESFLCLVMLKSIQLCSYSAPDFTLPTIKYANQLQPSDSKPGEPRLDTATGNKQSEFSLSWDQKSQQTLDLPENKSLVTWLLSKKHSACFHSLFQSPESYELTHYCEASKLLCNLRTEPPRTSNPGVFLSHCVAHSEKVLQTLELLDPEITLIIEAFVEDFFLNMDTSRYDSTLGRTAYTCLETGISTESCSGESRKKGYKSFRDTPHYAYLKSIRGTCTIDPCDICFSEKSEVLIQLTVAALESVPALSKIHSQNRVNLYEKLAICAVSSSRRRRLSASAAISRILWMPICSPHLVSKYKSKRDVSIYSLWLSIVSSIADSIIKVLKKNIWRICPKCSEFDHESILEPMACVLSTISNALCCVVQEYKTLKQHKPEKANIINTILSFEVLDSSKQLASVLEDCVVILLTSNSVKTRSSAVKVLRDARSIYQSACALANCVSQASPNDERRKSETEHSQIPPCDKPESARMIDVVENLKLSDVISQDSSVLVFKDDSIIPSLCQGKNKCFLSSDQCRPCLDMTVEKLATSTNPIHYRIWSYYLPSILKYLYSISPCALLTVYEYSNNFAYIFLSGLYRPMSTSVDYVNLHTRDLNKCSYEDGHWESSRAAGNSAKNDELFCRYKQCRAYISILLSLFEMFDNGTNSIGIEQHDKTFTTNSPSSFLDYHANSKIFSPFLILKMFITAAGQHNSHFNECVISSVLSLNPKFYSTVSDCLCKLLLSASEDLKGYIKLEKIALTSKDSKLHPEAHAGKECEISGMLHLLVHFAPLFKAEGFVNEGLHHAIEKCSKVLMDCIDTTVNSLKKTSEISHSFAQLVCLMCSSTIIAPEKNLTSEDTCFPSEKFREEVLLIHEKWLMFFLSNNADEFEYRQAFKMKEAHSTLGYVKFNITNLFKGKNTDTMSIYLKAIFSTLEYPEYSSDRKSYKGALHKIFTWTDFIFQCSYSQIISIGESYLKNIIMFNINDVILFKILIYRSYRVSHCFHMAAERYFSILSTFSLSSSAMKNYLPIIIPLVIYYLSYPDISTKLRAITMIDSLSLISKPASYSSAKDSHSNDTPPENSQKCGSGTTNKSIENYLYELLEVAHLKKDNSALEKVLSRLYIPNNGLSCADLQLTLSEKLSEKFQNLKLYIVSGLTNIAINLLASHVDDDSAPQLSLEYADSAIRSILHSITPWLNGISLCSFSPKDASFELSNIHATTREASLDISSSSSSCSSVLLDNILYLTALFCTEYPKPISNMWKLLASNEHSIDCVCGKGRENGNVYIIVNYLIKHTISFESWSMFKCSKFVMKCMQDSNCEGELSRCLLRYITPENTTSFAHEGLGLHRCSSMYNCVNAQEDARITNEPEVSSQEICISGFGSDLNRIMGNSPRFSVDTPCKLSLMYVYELCIDISRYKTTEFSLVLHALCSYAAGSNTLTSNLFHRFISRTMRACLPACYNPTLCKAITEMERLVIPTLYDHSGKSIHDISDAIGDGGSLVALVKLALSLSADARPDIEYEWGSTALCWFMDSPNNLISAISLKVFDIISPSMSGKLMEILDRRVISMLSSNNEDDIFRITSTLALMKRFLNRKASLSGDVISTILDLSLTCIRSPNREVHIQGIDLVLCIIYYVIEKRDTISPNLIESIHTFNCDAELLYRVIGWILSKEDNCEIYLELLNTMVLSDVVQCGITDLLRVLAILVNTPGLVYEISTDPRDPSNDNKQSEGSDHSFREPRCVAKLIADKLLKDKKDTRLESLFSLYSCSKLRLRRDFISALIDGIGDLYFPKYFETLVIYLLHLALSSRRKDATVYLSMLKTLFDSNKSHMRNCKIKVGKFIKTLSHVVPLGDMKPILEMIESLISCCTVPNSARSDSNSENTFSMSPTTKFDSFGLYPCPTYDIWDNVCKTTYEHYLPKDIKSLRRMMMDVDNSDFHPNRSSLTYTSSSHIFSAIKRSLFRSRGPVSSGKSYLCGEEHLLYQDSKRDSITQDLFHSKSPHVLAPMSTCVNLASNYSSPVLERSSHVCGHRKLLSKKRSSYSTNTTLWIAQNIIDSKADVMKSLDYLDLFFKNRMPHEHNSDYSHPSCSSADDDNTFDGLALADDGQYEDIRSL